MGVVSNKILNKALKASNDSILQLPDKALSWAGKSLELRQVLRPLFPWWWALILVPITSAVLGYYFIQQSSVYYQARMLVQVGPSIDQLGNQISPVVTSRLASIYSQVVYQNNFLRLVAQQSNIGLSADQIQQAILVQNYEVKSSFEVQIVDNNPTRSLRILETIGNVLEHETPQLKDLLQKTQQQFINEWRIRLKIEIENRQQEFENLNLEIIKAGEINERNLDLYQSASQLKAEIDEYSLELQKVEEIPDFIEVNRLQIAEEPHLLINSFGPQPKSAAFAMAVVSLVLLIFFIYLAHKFDTRLQSVDQAERILGQKVIFQPKRSDRKQAITKYDLLAADLTAIYLYNQGFHRLKLLIIAEEPITSIFMMPLQFLMKALTDLGMKTTMSKEASNRECSLKSQTESTLVDWNVEWELVFLNWPNVSSYITQLDTPSTSVLVCCSLKRSNIKSLQNLATFLKTSSYNVGGILLV